jgi:hypothetical protein
MPVRVPVPVRVRVPVPVPVPVPVGRWSVGESHRLDLIPKCHWKLSHFCLSHRHSYRMYRLPHRTIATPPSICRHAIHGHGHPHHGCRRRRHDL